MNSKVQQAENATGESLHLQIFRLLAELVEASPQSSTTACSICAPLALHRFHRHAAESGKLAVNGFRELADMMRGLAVPADSTKIQRGIIGRVVPKIEEYAESLNAAWVAEEAEKKAARELAAEKQRYELTRDTLLSVRQPLGLELVRDAVFKIETLSAEIQNLANEADVDSDTAGPCEVIRSLALRVKDLNSVAMSALDGEDITLADGYKVLHGAEVGYRTLDADIASAAPVVRPGTQADFMAGVQLATRLAQVGKAISADKTRYDQVNLLAEYREDESGADRPQNNFALHGIRELIANPAWAEGFAAVLSDALGCFGADYNTWDLEDLEYSKIVGSVPQHMPAPTPEADFMEGVGLALDIYKAGEALSNNDSPLCEMAAKYRYGEAHNNFALPFVGTLVEIGKNPALVEGFAAVLSNICGSKSTPSHSELAALTYFDITRPLTAEQAAALIEEEFNRDSEAADVAEGKAKAKPAKAPKQIKRAKPVTA